jgi:hypothetical protein
MRQLVPPVFVLFLLSVLALPAFILRTSFGKEITLAWICCFAAYIFGGALAAMKQKAKPMQFPGVIFSFFLLHTGYGLGYLHGIIKFILFRGQPGQKEQRLSR